MSENQNPPSSESGTTVCSSCQDLEDLRSTFDLMYEANQRGITKWQQATGKDMTWPDHAKLVAWLLDRIDAAESVIDVAREIGKVEYPADEKIMDHHAVALDVSLHIAKYEKRYGL